MGQMSRIAIPAIAGIVAVAVLAGGYFGLTHYGIHLDTDKTMVIATILVFGAAIALFTQMAMSQAASANSYQRRRLSDEFAQHSISLFRGEDKLQFLARPDVSVGEILV